MSGSLTGATSTGRGLRRTKEEYQAGERENERGLRKQTEDCVSRGRAEEEERAARTAGVQEQREDCGSVQGKIDKELEGQAWIKERRERGHL
jgi:hypothetical protein